MLGWAMLQMREQMRPLLQDVQCSQAAANLQVQTVTSLHHWTCSCRRAWTVRQDCSICILCCTACRTNDRPLVRMANVLNISSMSAATT
jgi:hypothetical protein